MPQDYVQILVREVKNFCYVYFSVVYPSESPRSAGFIPPILAQFNYLFEDEIKNT